MKNTEKRNVWLGLSLFLVLFAILVLRSFFSFCQTDESFYASLANRLWSGERMFWDEWNSTQVYVPLLLPLYACYMCLAGSTEGVLLFLRLCCVCFSLIVSLKLFHLVLRETGHASIAALAASVILLFSRGNIQGLSYYNLCMLCGVSGFCSLAEADRCSGAGRILRNLWAGVLIACAVVCNPFLAPFILLLVLLGLLRKKTARAAGCALLGMVIAACLYFGYILLTTGLGRMLETLPYVLDSPEQSSIGQNLLSSLREAAHLSKLVCLPALLMSAVMLIKSWDQTADRLLLPYLLLQTALLAMSAVQTVTWICGAALIPMTVIAFPFFLCALRAKCSPYATALYVFGVLNALAYVLASNTGIDAGNVGFCMSAAAGFWLAYDALKPEKPGIRARKAVLAAMMLAVLAPLFCQRVIGVYRDAPIYALTVRLTQGPAKNLRTTPEHAALYESLCDALNAFSDQVPAGRILYVKNCPWAYLQTEGFGYATSSPWRTYTEDLERYYAVHPENRPDYICLLEEHVAGWEKSVFNRNPAVGNPNAFDYDVPFWTGVRGAPLVMQTDFLQIYDVRELW